MPLVGCTRVLCIPREEHAPRLLGEGGEGTHMRRLQLQANRTGFQMAAAKASHWTIIVSAPPGLPFLRPGQPSCIRLLYSMSEMDVSLMINLALFRSPFGCFWLRMIHVARFSPWSAVHRCPYREASTGCPACRGPLSGHRRASHSIGCLMTSHRPGSRCSVHRFCAPHCP